MSLVICSVHHTLMEFKCRKIFRVERIAGLEEHYVRFDSGPTREGTWEKVEAKVDTPWQHVRVKNSIGE